MRGLVLLVMAGCGRVGFDGLGGDATGDGQAPAVPALVQSRTWANFASGAAQTMNATTAGSLLVVAIDVNSSTQNVSTVSDNTADAFVSANVSSISINNPGGAAISEIWYATNIAGGANAITITTSGGAALWDATIIEVTGAATASPIDGAMAQSNIAGPTTTSSGLALATMRDNTLVVQLNAATGVIGLMTGSAFTNIPTGGNDNVAYLIGAHPPGTYQPFWTCSQPCGQYNVSAVGFAAR